MQVRRRVFLEGEELEAFWEKEKLAKQQAEKWIKYFYVQTCITNHQEKYYIIIMYPTE